MVENHALGSKTIRIYGLVPDSIVDGPGLRYAIFTQGCTHACPGCHNPESHSADGGNVYTVKQIFDDIISNKLIEGVTLSGGDPFEQVEACAELAQMLASEGVGIWAYTGYLYEDLLERSKEDPAIKDLLDHLDVLVDGPFIEAKKSLGLDWKGSSNQRVIDIKKTKEAGKVVLWEQPMVSYEPPPSW